MRYHSHPPTYPWSSMLNNLPTSGTAWVMAAIGVAVTMAYTCDGSGVVLSNAATALTDSFGYSTALYGNYNYTTVVNEIKTFNRPVILGGGRKTGWWIFGVFAEGHAWVCDGTRETEYYRCYLQDGNLYSTPYMGYLHLNMSWSWDGNFNGFYAFNNFNPSTHTFNYNTTQIVNIKP